MAVEIKSGAGATKATVDTQNRLTVQHTDADEAAALSNPGARVAAVALVDPDSTGRYHEISGDFKLRAGIDTQLAFISFLGTTSPTRHVDATATTHTVAMANGVITLNSASSTAIGAAQIQTPKTLTQAGSNPIYCKSVIKSNVWVQANTIIETGWGIASASAAPTDGIYFRGSVGGFYAVVNNNAVEIATLIATPTINETHEFLIEIGQTSVLFWIDDTLVYTFLLAGGAVGWERPTRVQAHKAFVREYVSVAVAAVAPVINISQLDVSLGDANSGRSAETIAAGAGFSSYQTQMGTAAGQTALWANSAVPATAALSNTVPSYTTLGGLFLFAATAGAETDYVLFNYTNPAGSITLPPRTLMVKGVWVDSFSRGAVGSAATPTCFQWGVGVGATAASLATVDGATTKSHARIPLGTQAFSINTPVGTAGGRIYCEFSSPLVVDAGLNLSIILRIIEGAATASQQFRGCVGINGYFE